MTQGRQQPDPTSPPEHAPSPMPAIHGVRARESFTGDITPFDPDAIATAAEEASTQPPSTTDPWGVEDPTANREPESVPPQEPAQPRRGGGILTIPLLCVGI